MSLQPPPLPAACPAPTVQERYRAFVLAKIGGKRSPLLIGLGILMCCSVAALPLGLHLLIMGLRKRRKHPKALKAELAFVERAQLILAYPLMVNRMLRRPGNEPAPGLVLVSFDQGMPATPDVMMQVAETIADPASAGLPAADVRFLGTMMADEEYQQSRRRKLPMSLTAGHTIYACDLAIHPGYLPNRHLSEEMPLVPCLAEPGEQGRIRAIPSWLFLNAPPPPWALQTPLFIA